MNDYQKTVILNELKSNKDFFLSITPLERNILIKDRLGSDSLVLLYKKISSKSNINATRGLFVMCRLHYLIYAKKFYKFIAADVSEAMPTVINKLTKLLEDLPSSEKNLIDKILPPVDKYPEPWGFIDHIMNNLKKLESIKESIEDNKQLISKKKINRMIRIEEENKDVVRELIPSLVKTNLKSRKKNK